MELQANRNPGLPRPRLLATFFATWLACGVVAALVMNAAEGSNRSFYSRLESHGIAVVARVTRTEVANHNLVYYVFTASGRRYSSADSAATVTSPGKLIQVVYDARDPNVSCACDPRREAAGLTWWHLLLDGLWLGATAAAVITYSIKRRLDRSLGGNAGSPASP